MDYSIPIEKMIDIARTHLEYVVRKMDTVQRKIEREKHGTRDENRIERLMAKQELLYTERRYVKAKIISLIEAAALQELERERVEAGSRNHLPRDRD